MEVRKKGNLIWRVVTYLLVAAILGLLPAAVVRDFYEPYSAWEEWEDGRRALNEHWYSNQNLPVALKVDRAIFMMVVLPPAFLLERPAPRTSYGQWALTLWRPNPGASFHHHPPPSLAALEWLPYGIAFWFLSLSVLSEGGRWLLASRRRRRAT